MPTDNNVERTIQRGTARLCRARKDQHTSVWVPHTPVVIEVLTDKGTVGQMRGLAAPRSTAGRALVKRSSIALDLREKGYIVVEKSERPTRKSCSQGRRAQAPKRGYLKEAIKDNVGVVLTSPDRFRGTAVERHRDAARAASSRVAMQCPAELHTSWRASPPSRNRGEES